MTGCVIFICLLNVYAQYIINVSRLIYQLHEVSLRKSRSPH